MLDSVHSVGPRLLVRDGGWVSIDVSDGMKKGSRIHGGGKKARDDSCHTRGAAFGFVPVRVSMFGSCPGTAGRKVDGAYLERFEGHILIRQYKKQLRFL